MAVICQSLKTFATLGNRVKATTHLTSQFFGSIQMRMSQQPKQTFFRCYWQEIIRAHPDPHEPKRQKFEDPGLAAIRSARAQNSEGMYRYPSKLSSWQSFFLPCIENSLICCWKYTTNVHSIGSILFSCTLIINFIFLLSWSHIRITPKAVKVSSLRKTMDGTEASEGW